MPKYQVEKKTLAELRDRHAYHPAVSDQPERYAANRDDCYDLAVSFCERCPPCAELTLALRKLQEAMMYANAAIAVHEKSDDKPGA